MIEIDNLRKLFGAKPVLEIPSLVLNKDIYWLKGNNGSGKTTFLKILSGLLPFEGNISVNGVNIKKHPLQYRKSISYAEAEPLYPSYLTGRDLLDFFSAIRKADKSDLKNLTDIFQIGPYIDSPIGTYSSGMIKKLSLVLAFTGNPQWILLDEPLVTLDTATAPKVYELITGYYEHRGTAFLLASHQHFTKTQILGLNELTIENQTIHYAHDNA